MCIRDSHKIGSTTTTTDYCGNVIYENGTKKLLLTEEGYINLTGTQQYHYYLKDHQGNNLSLIHICIKYYIPINLILLEH